jgi:hypothetical protein
VKLGAVAWPVKPKPGLSGPPIDQATERGRSRRLRSGIEVTQGNGDAVSV